LLEEDDDDVGTLNKALLLCPSIAFLRTFLLEATVAPVFHA
jgi:hypothetical protein